jgi:hypothetical protein
MPFATDVDHGRWLKRPMDKTSLLYAAEDIGKIQQLYDVFVDEGYIDEDALVQQSASYMELHAEARPLGGKYQRHGLLPLAIFWVPATSLMQCRGCERDLPDTCFSQSAARGRIRICFVCRAVDVREQLSPWKRR